MVRVPGIFSSNGSIISHVDLLRSISRLDAHRWPLTVHTRAAVVFAGGPQGGTILITPPPPPNGQSGDSALANQRTCNSRDKFVSSEIL